MNTVYQLASASKGVSPVDLADGTRRYRKQLVKFGNYVDPHGRIGKMILDRSWAERVVRNFRSKIAGQVPVVDGHPKTSAELLAATRGELVGLSVEDDGLYGELEIRDPQAAKKIDDKLAFDNSISYHEDYLDKTAGHAVGPALRHIGLVNDPYIKGMAPFQALSDDANVIMLSESEESTMPKLKNEHAYPVTVKVDGKDVELQPGAEVEVSDAELEAVTKQLADAPKPETAEEKVAREAKEAADKKAADEKAEADRKATEDKAKAEGDTNAQLEAANKENARLKQELSERDASNAYTVALSEGKVVPAQEEAFKKLFKGTSTATIELSDGKTEALSDVLAEFVKTMPKRVDLSEKGTSGGDGNDGKTPFQKQTPDEQEKTLAMGISEEEYNKINGNASSSDSDGKKE